MSPPSKKDVECLLALRTATHGESWPERLRWDLEKDPSLWPGVKFDSDGRVVAIELEVTRGECEILGGHGARMFFRWVMINPAHPQAEKEPGWESYRVFPQQLGIRYTPDTMGPCRSNAIHIIRECHARTKLGVLLIGKCINGVFL